MHHQRYIHQARGPFSAQPPSHHTDILSLAAMPAAPFEFEISHTNFRIIVTNYGDRIPSNDASGCIRKALNEIEDEIYTHWTDKDIPITEDLVFTSGWAKLKLNTAPFMYRTYCLMLMVGVIEWGQNYGFIEVDMEFVEKKDSARRKLGTGSLRMNGAES